MYRQTLIHPDDAKFHKIFFRKNVAKPLLLFMSNTVTYGTSCAPYLAIRVLHQLADDEKGRYPKTAITLKRDFYVDDLLSGATTREEAEVFRDELTNLLQSDPIEKLDVKNDVQNYVKNDVKNGVKNDVKNVVKTTSKMS